MKNNWPGSATPLVFGFIMVLFIIFGGLYFLISSSQQAVVRVQANEDLRDELNSAFETVYPAVVQTLSQDANSSFDDYSAISDTIDEYNTSTDGNAINDWQLRDISSRLNINWVHPKLLEEEHLSSLLPFSGRYQEFIDLRNKAGLTLKYTDVYQDLIPNDLLETLFSAYGVANIDVSYTDSIRTLALKRTGDEAFTETLYESIKTKLQALSLWTEDELETALIPYFDELRPLVNLSAMYNVNYLPAEVLQSILYYHYGNEDIPELEQAFGQLITLRERQEVSDELLEDLLNLDSITTEHPLTARVKSYLGTRTWFWELIIYSNGASLRAVLFRSPADDNFSIIEYSVSESEN